jgi:hypothetical protein
MILKVTLADCSFKIEDCMEGRITHDELRAWARDAMMAMDIPAHEYEEIMALLQDINTSTKENLRVAFKHYQKFNSPLTQGLPKSWLQ